MNNILDDINRDEKSTANFKKWSFRLFIWAIIAYLVFAYKVANFLRLILQDEKAFGRDLNILSFFIIACLLIGSILTWLSFKNKEEKTYEYLVSIWGYPILIGLTLLAIVNL
mgnify:CR=1 FL=1